jgi:hypothetical protein
MPRDAAQVACTLVHRLDQLGGLRDPLVGADRIAIDTEASIYGPHRGEMRMMSIATRSGAEARAFVVDVRDLDPGLLGPMLTGFTADAWNANFDARVVDAAVWNTSDTTNGITWWDAQLADALIHQGRSGFNWYHGLA